MLKEFKKFALKGNMIDLAVGVIIGGGFNTLVTSMVNDIIMPVISLFTGRLDFTNMFVALDGQHYTTLAEAQAHTSTIAYGSFITGLINFRFAVWTHLRRFWLRGRFFFSAKLINPANDQKDDKRR